MDLVEMCFPLFIVGLMIVVSIVSWLMKRKDD